MWSRARSRLGPKGKKSGAMTYGSLMMKESSYSLTIANINLPSTISDALDTAVGNAATKRDQ